MNEKPIDDGGPAFPGIMYPIDEDQKFVHGPPGMSLRDWFASQCLAGLIQGSTNPRNAEDWAASAYKLADAMLAERLKP